MAVFGSFVYGSGQVYGQQLDILVESIEVIHPRLLRIQISDSIVVNDDFFNVNNYAITYFRDTNTDVLPKRVLQPYQSNSSDRALHTSTIYLEVDKLTIGTRYTLVISNLLTINGITITPSQTHILARRTKTKSMLDGISDHFDKRFTSNLASIIAAISISDDVIGGSKKDLI